MTEIVITGVGAVSTAGAGIDRLWEALFKNPVPNAIDVPDFVAPQGADRHTVQRTDLFAQFAWMAALEACPRPPEVAPWRRSVVFANSMSGPVSYHDAEVALAQLGPRHVSKALPTQTIPNAGAAIIASEFDAQGPSLTLSTACAAGTQAIGVGAAMLRAGEADWVLVAAGDRPTSQAVQAAYRNVGALSPKGIARPFDRDRDGFVLVGGGAAVVLERESDAKRSGASVLGRLHGWGASMDARSVTRPRLDGESAERCIRQALDRAALPPDRLCYVSAHGTGTRLNDAAEAAVLARVLGNQSVPVGSIKGAIGHSAAAAGMLEAIAVVLAIEHRELPPTIGLRRVDESLPKLDFLTATRPWQPGPSLSCSFGLGGQNAAVVLGPP